MTDTPRLRETAIVLAAMVLAIWGGLVL